MAKSITHALAGILIAKSLPVWLAWWVACGHHAAWADSYLDATWSRALGAGKE